MLFPQSDANIEHSQTISCLFGFLNMFTLSPCHLVKRNAKNQPILPSLGIQGIRQAWDVWHVPAPSHALDHGTYVGVFCVSSTTELNIMGALSGVL